MGSGQHSELSILIKSMVTSGKLQYQKWDPADGDGIQTPDSKRFKQEAIMRLKGKCCYDCGNNLIHTEQCWKDCEVPAFAPNNICDLPEELTCEDWEPRYGDD